MQATSQSEREEFRRSVRAFLELRSSEAEVRRLIPDDLGYDPEVWKQLSDQLELPGLLVPEEYGGQGFSPIEAAVVLEESGRTLLSSPFFASSVLATWALLNARPESGQQRSALVASTLSALADGSTIATLALDEQSDERAAATKAVQRDSSWRISGVKTRVFDGHAADLLLVTAELEDGRVGLFLVERGAPGVSVSALTPLDLTRRQSKIEFSDTPAECIDDDFRGGLAATLDFGAIAASAELLGVASRALEIAVDYALTREQFGRPIGSFQAIKHLLAESLATVEQMRAAVYTAAGQSPETFGEVSSVVKAYASDSGPRVAETLIQVLGGIGYTWEHVAHLYLRRAKSLEYLFGTAAEHRARLAIELGLVSA
ncbi:acyl-CoA dehydrogenase family protein [Jatrophihabitans sp. DSM 45814]